MLIRSALLIAILCATTTSAAQPQGPQPLTAATLQQAIADGVAGRVPLYGPLLMRTKTVDDKVLKTELPRGDAPKRELLAAMTSAPFMIVIDTPYSTVADRAAEATRTFSQMPSDWSGLDQGIGIRIAPSKSMTHADAVERVVLKKEGRVIMSLSAKVEPATMQNAMGASRELASGTFLFPYEAFRPDAPLTIVVVGRRGNWEWTMTRGELAQLR